MSHRDLYIVYLVRTGRAVMYRFHRLMWLVQFFEIVDRAYMPRLTLNRHQDDQ